MLKSMAFIMAVIPPVISTGVGAEMRSAMGVAGFSGMIDPTFFWIFTTPILCSGPSSRRKQAVAPACGDRDNGPRPDRKDLRSTRIDRPATSP